MWKKAIAVEAAFFSSSKRNTTQYSYKITRNYWSLNCPTCPNQAKSKPQEFIRITLSGETYKKRKFRWFMLCLILLTPCPQLALWVWGYDQKFVHVTWGFKNVFTMKLENHSSLRNISIGILFPLLIISCILGCTNFISHSKNVLFLTSIKEV